MRLLATLSLLVWVGGAAFAQARTPRPPAKKAAPKAEAPAPAPTKWPVEALFVEGLQNYTREQVLQVAGLKLGQMAGKPEFEAARDRLVASGAFETVGYKFEAGPNKEGYIATFQVTEVATAYPVRFEELGVPEKEVESMLLAKDPLFSAARMPVTKPVMDRYLAWIQDYLTAKGVQEKVAGRVTAMGPD